jgi:hypothetical protein
LNRDRSQITQRNIVGSKLLETNGKKNLCLWIFWKETSRLSSSNDGELEQFNGTISQQERVKTEAMKIYIAFIVAPALATAETMCPFLATDAAPPIEFDLPAKALSVPIVDLPLKFQGIHPIVTRRDVPYGSSPKLIVQRYSAAPDIVYDEMMQSIVITSASCSSEVASSTSSAMGNRRFPSSRWMAMAAATCFVGMLDERLRPSAAALALSVGFSGVHGVRVLQEACMPTVEVIVEAPLAYQGAVATCQAEIKDPIVCPNPFPSYATCSNPAPTCSVAVVGAGAGGLYTALR